jgi:RNA polymerase sigma-70 factor (ECF subfamily)
MATQATSPPDSESADLVRRVRLGNSQALGELYDAFGAGLYRLAYRLSGSREDAEDTVHDVFVGLPEALDRYEERGRLGAWLRRVTARVALMRLRRRNHRREVGLERADGVAAPNPHDRTSEHAALQAAVDALPVALRSVLVLKEMEGYSHAEVAEMLGINAVTSRVRLLRALRRVRRELEDHR